MLSDQLMSVEVVVQFREAVNANGDWQEKIRNFGSDDTLVSFAKGKGYEFSQEEYDGYVDGNDGAELSEWEMELVAGGMDAHGNK